jgi:hypothetical protein
VEGPSGQARDMKRSLRSSGEIARPVGVGETEQKRTKAPAAQGPYSRAASKDKVGMCVRVYRVGYHGRYRE